MIIILTKDENWASPTVLRVREAKVIQNHLGWYRNDRPRGKGYHLSYIADRFCDVCIIDVTTLGHEVDKSLTWVVRDHQIQWPFTSVP